MRGGEGGEFRFNKLGGGEENKSHIEKNKEYCEVYKQMLKWEKLARTRGVSKPVRTREIDQTGPNPLSQSISIYFLQDFRFLV